MSQVLSMSMTRSINLICLALWSLLLYVVYGSGGNNITNRSTIHVAFIAQAVTPTIRNLAQARLVGLEAAIRASPLLSTEVATVVSHVYATADVPTPSVLYHDNILHATYADGLNTAVPLAASNITFTIFEQPPDALVDKSNVEFLVIPVEAAGFQAGLLAGQVSTKKIVAVMYAHFYPTVLDGVREGLRQVCPLCSMVTLGVCSGSYACPGQMERFFELAADADVVVVAMHGSNFIPRRIFAYNTLNATALNRPKKFVVSIGNYLSDIAPDVLQNPFHLGMLSLSMPSMLAGVLAAIEGTFVNSLGTVPMSWSRNFTNGTRNPGISGSAIAEFLLVQQLFLWGAYAPTYDGIVTASHDADLIGGLPLIPVGLSVSGLLPTDSVAVDDPTTGDDDGSKLLPNISTHNVCALRDRVLLLSSDLATMTILSTMRTQVNVLSVQLPVDAYADAQQNATFGLEGFYNLSRRVHGSDAITWRVGMVCNELGSDGSTVILSGGNAVDPTTLEPTGLLLHDVLRIRFVCLDPYSVRCDFFILENITDEIQWAGGYGMFVAPYDINGPAWSSSSSSSSPSPSSSSSSSSSSDWTYAIPVYTQAVMTAGNTSIAIINTTTLDTIAIAKLLPPQGIPSTAFAPAMGTWVAEKQWIVALDRSSNTIVALRDPLMHFSPLSAVAATTTIHLQWEYVTEPLPTSTTPLCFFLDAATDRFVAVVVGSIRGGGGADGAAASEASVSLHHYSTVLRRWVYQTALSGAVDAAYYCVPLHHNVDDITTGGSSSDSAFATVVLYPTTTRTLNHLVLVKYPRLVPECEPEKGQVLDKSHATCVQCGAHEAASSDGFCIPAASTSAIASWVWAAIGLAVGVVVVACVVLGGIHLHRVRFSPAAQRTLWRERAMDAVNAPPSGPCAVLSIVIADADYLWSQSGGGDNSGASNPLNDSSKSNKLRGVRPPRSPNDMRAVVDRLHDVLCRSVAANRCFMVVFRGDHAVVIGSAPTHVLCVAVEAALSMAHSNPPIRLSCGLHMGELLRTVDGGLNRYLYAGTALPLTTRIALLPTSTSGAITASEVFLAAVGDAAVKSLGIVRADTRVLQSDSSTVAVRELVVSHVADALGNASAFDTAQQRRRKLLQQKRQRAVAGSTTPHSAPRQQRASQAEVQPHAQQQQPQLMASTIEENAQPTAGVHEVPQLPEQVPDVPVMVSPTGLHPFATCESMSSPLTPFDSDNPLVPPPHSEEKETSATAARCGGTKPHPPMTVVVSDVRGQSPTTHHLQPQHQHQQPPTPTNASPSFRGKLAGITWSGSHTMSGSGQYGVGAPLPRTSMHELESHETEVLIGLATSIGRILLAQLAEHSALGAEATTLMVEGLHLPNFKPMRDGAFPSVVPPATLRFFAHRLVSICYADIVELLRHDGGRGVRGSEGGVGACGRFDGATPKAAAILGGQRGRSSLGNCAAAVPRRKASTVVQHAADNSINNNSSCLESQSSMDETFFGAPTQRPACEDPAARPRRTSPSTTQRIATATATAVGTTTAVHDPSMLHRSSNCSSDVYSKCSADHDPPTAAAAVPSSMPAGGQQQAPTIVVVQPPVAVLASSLDEPSPSAGAVAATNGIEDGHLTIAGVPMQRMVSTSSPSSVHSVEAVVAEDNPSSPALSFLP